MGWRLFPGGYDSGFSGSYNESLSLVYMAARLDGGFAAVSRAFHEVKAPQLPTFYHQFPYS